MMQEVSENFEVSLMNADELSGADGFSIFLS